MKDATVRINDTVAFILACNLLTAAERTAAHHFVDAFVRLRYPVAQANLPGYQAFSNAMALGFHLAQDPNAFRKMKRCAYLMAHAINDHVGYVAVLVPNPAQLTDPQAQTQCQNLIRLCALFDGLNQRLQDLINNPLVFLLANKLVVNGGTTTSGGAQNIKTFHFSYDLNLSRYVIGADARAGSVSVQVDSVVAQKWTTACDWLNNQGVGGDFRLISATELASALMITTQFTGCTFCMKSHGGHVYCAHIQPARDDAANAAPMLTGTQVAGLIANNNGVHGDFANAAGGNPLSLYGPGFSQNLFNGQGGYPNGLGGGGSYMTVIGVRRGVSYEVYSQVMQNQAISSAQRIF